MERKTCRGSRQTKCINTVQPGLRRASGSGWHADSALPTGGEYPPARTVEQMWHRLALPGLREAHPALPLSAMPHSVSIIAPTGRKDHV